MTVQRILDAKGKGAAHIGPDGTIADFLQSLELQNADALVVSNDSVPPPTNSMTEPFSLEVPTTV